MTFFKTYGVKQLKINIIFGKRLIMGGITIKWKENCIVDMSDIEGDEEGWIEAMSEGETFDVEKVDMAQEDAENGSIMHIYNEGVMIVANEQWFEVID